MASDGSIVIDVTVDSEKLAASLETLGGLVSASALKMGAGFSDTLSERLKESVSQAREAAANAVLNAGFESIGQAVSTGLANGIRNGYQAVSAAASTVMNGVKSLITESVQVRSPSVWAAGIGGFIAEGLSEGIKDGAAIVNEAAKTMMEALTGTVQQKAETLVSLELDAIDEIIKAEKRAVSERERTRQLELRQRAIDIAVDSDVKRMAVEHLYATEREYALQDLEEYKRHLQEKQKVFEEQKEAQIRAIKDVSYEERTLAYDDHQIKLTLYNEEYLEKVRAIDEGLYAFLSAKNAEMEAVIERIALEDEATAERLASILEEKNALIEKSRVEKELRDERLRDEKEAQLLQRMYEAETYEEQTKRAQEYNKWREEEEYRLAEKTRQERINGLNDEYKAILSVVKEAQQEIDNIRKEGDGAIERAAEAIKTGIVDLEAEKENMNLSVEQQSQYLSVSYQMAQKYFGDRATLVSAETNKEYEVMRRVNENLVALFRQYVPLWYDVGAQLMSNLHAGLSERLYEVTSLLSRLRYELESLSILSGSGFDVYGVPMYGTGGVVTTPRLAVVGDVPEAIIPLHKLNDVIIKAATLAAPAINGANGAGTGLSNQVFVNQTNNIYQPVKSPAETARAIKNMSRGLAWGL